MPKFFIYPWAIAGDKTPPIPNPTQPDGSVSYQAGFTSDYQLVYGVDPNAKAIPRTAFNNLMYEITLNIQQYQTNGTPNFITSADNGGSPYPYPLYALVRFDDGSGVQLFVSLVSNNTTDPTNTTNWAVFSADGFQPGDSKDYCGATIPPGRWLAQDGTVYNIVDYPLLAAAIGNLWGGDGITTFAVPNAQRRVMMGSGGSGSATIGNAVGDIGGEETHTLTIGEMPDHNHPAPIATAPGTGIQTGAGAQNEETGLTGATGGGGAHNNVQPSMIVLKLIRY